MLPLALLSACGDDSGSSAAEPADTASVSEATSDSASASPSVPATSETPEKPKKPQCDEVWVEGATLPWGYEQCYDGERRVKANGRYCEIGKPLITYRTNWYATPGGPVNKTDSALQDDPGYQQAVKACGG